MFSYSEAVKEFQESGSYEIEINDAKKAKYLTWTISVEEGFPTYDYGAVRSINQFIRYFVFLFRTLKILGCHPEINEMLLFYRAVRPGSFRVKELDGAYTFVFRK